jgi:hypothetical protein
MNKPTDINFQSTMYFDNADSHEVKYDLQIKYLSMGCLIINILIVENLIYITNRFLRYTTNF